MLACHVIAYERNIFMVIISRLRPSWRFIGGVRGMEIALGPIQLDGSRGESFCQGTRLNACDAVPLQAYCASWAPLLVEGVPMQRPELSALNV